MMPATLMFVHGRGQEFQDPAVLVRTWQAGLAAGLLKAGVSGVEAAPVVFPFYGNLLYRITAEIAQDPVHLEILPAEPDEAGPIHPYMPEDVGTLERELLTDMSRAVGVPQAEALDFGPLLSWRAFRSVLTFIARHTRADQAVITEHLRDVAVYLTRARDQVLDLVRNAIPPAVPIVLISHSLGTVVARDLLDDAALRQRVRLWGTTGSPLGLEAVQRNLRTPGTHNPGVDWISAYDVHDIVALGHPLRPTWGSPLRDIEVDNGDSPHSIERYLGHPEVAAPIGAAVG